MGMGPLGIGTDIQMRDFNDFTVEETLHKHMEYTPYRVDEDLVQTYFNKTSGGPASHTTSSVRPPRFTESSTQSGARAS